jgi:hypothetical protein
VIQSRTRPRVRRLRERDIEGLSGQRATGQSR